MAGASAGGEREHPEVRVDRRRLLQSVPSFLIASSLPLSWSGAATAAKKSPPAALLIPKSGDLAALGRSMERAALLAQGDNKAGELIVFDTGDTAEGAAAAAEQARKKGAGIILGPVHSGSVRGVVAAAAGIPVVAFGNDAALRESGAFMLGITARQSVSSVLRYAAGRGIRRVAVADLPGAWSSQVNEAARAEAQSLGLEVSTFSPQTGLPQSVAGSTDGYPDAVLMADKESLARLMPEIAAIGVQALGAFAELDLDPSDYGALQGTWLSAADPERFSAFANEYEKRIGTRPGLISALAYDAAMAVRRMRLTGALDRSAVLSGDGFAGVCGHVRFREDGSAAREMVVLEVATTGVRKVHPAA
ncbi:penicillin-binding protein activator [Tsuneonella sp. HG222]